MKILFLDSGQGVLPFIKEILIQKKKGDFIFYLDEIHFPYGNKTAFETRNILSELLVKFDKMHINKLFIACNTLSSLLDENDTFSYKIDNILTFNLNHMDKDAYYLCTKLTSIYLKKIGIKTYYLSELAALIEENNIKKLVLYLKNHQLPNKIILGCTHYPLIKFLFNRYSKSKIYSYEDKYIASLEDEGELKITIYTNKKEVFKKILLTPSIIYHSLT